MAEQKQRQRKNRHKVKDSTQDHLEILDIIDDVLITRNGGAAMILQTNAVNFDLLSEYEQDNKIYAFAGLLNSLNFQIQILVKTQRIDITNYLKYLDKKKQSKMSAGLARLLDIYYEFIQNLIVTNDVLDKNFYIVIPYNPAVTLGKAKMKRSRKAENAEIVNFDKEKLVEKARFFLHPKRDHLMKQLSRMGLDAEVVESEELIQVFYEIYNPSIDE